MYGKKHSEETKKKMSQNDQLEFINWLQKKTNAKSDSELEQIVQEMGEDKINEMYAQFKASKSRSFKVGGVIDYVRSHETN